MFADEQNAFSRCSAGTAVPLNTVVVHIMFVSNPVSRRGISLFRNVTNMATSVNLLKNKRICFI
jgi:hypothetical protein